MPAPPRRPCPAGGAPRWPWPVPTLGPPEPIDDLFVPTPGRWHATWDRDPKPVWERHRGWALVRAAQAGDTSAVERWWATHRQTRGDLLWASTHAVAGRVPALIVLGHRESLWAHADHLHRHPSRHSSANNHRVAELAALALARAALPDAPGSFAQLPEVFAHQLHDDGWPKEQSIPYLAHILEWGLIAHRTGRVDVAEGLARGLRSLLAVLADDGQAMVLGDNGGDEVLPGNGQPYPLSVAGGVAVALGVRPPAAWRPDLRSRMLGLGSSPAGAAVRRGASFGSGGLTILRTARWAVALDHGPIGMKPLAAHGHADHLAMWAHLDGSPLFGGRGTSTYHVPLTRQRERSTAGSSALILDGRSTATPHEHPFLWVDQPRARLEHLRLADEGGEVVGTITCGDVVHRRHVHLHRGRLVVRDHLEGQGLHQVLLQWHLAPGVSAERTGWVGPAELNHHVTETPHASAYGRTEPAGTLRSVGAVRLPTVLQTVFHPS